MYLWQLPQNLVGLILSLTSKEKKTYTDVIDNKSVKVYYTKCLMGAGISLGNYILFDEKFLSFSHNTDIKHEYGHQKQSKYLGPLYLIVIGLPSVIGNVFDRVAHKNWSYQDRVKWYFNQPYESWADKLGGVIR